MHQSSAEPIILNYKQRRYDGGPEMELIAYLESQHKQLEITEAGSMGTLLEDILDDEEAQLFAAPMSRWRQMGEVLCIGPLELFVGILGMVTTGIAATVFSVFMNPTLSQQSRSVYTDCWETVKQGAVHMATAPLNLVRLVRSW
jgi:hypothetical protein